MKDIEIRMKAAQREHDQAAELARKRQEQQEAEIERLNNMLQLMRDTGEQAVNKVGEKNDKLEGELSEMNKARKEAEDRQKEAEQLALQREAEAAEALERANKVQQEAEQAREELSKDPSANLSRITDILELQKKQAAAAAAPPPPPPPPKSEFSNTGELILSVPCNGFTIDGLRFGRQVPRVIRDKIISNQHLSLEKLVTDPIIYAEKLAARKDKEKKLELGRPGYSTMNMPKSEEPLPDDIATKLQIFNRLFLFGHYYLQKFPEKMLGFFDYLMFLMEMSGKLNVRGLVVLDHLMREDFAAHPEWNWTQNRSESQFITTRVLSEPSYLLSQDWRQSSHQNNYRGQNNQNSQGRGSYRGGQNSWGGGAAHLLLRPWSEPTKPRSISGSRS